MQKLFGLILLLLLSNYSHAGLGSMGGGFSPNIDFSGVGSGPPNIVDLGLCPNRSYMTCGGTRDGSNSSTRSSVYDTKPLIFQVRVTPKSLKVELPFTKTQSHYNIEVDWGDGSAKSKISSYSDVDRFHTYSTEGDYTITMRGRADWMAFRGARQCHYLVKVVSLGELKYKNLQGAFYGCKKLTHFKGGDSKLSTKKVTSMAFMFSGAKKLESVDVSNFDTVEVKTYQSMFEGAKSLRTLDLGSFNGDKAKNMKRMFKGASALYAINLKGMYWFLDYDDFRKKVSVDEMFANTPKLKLNNILTTGSFLHEVAKEQK